ncbi:MAG: hypothetical protein D6718_07315 [Acidobacteria bacterium]|nr:MAG: hypothetical protein D6718_07315 [Acidobacteriota bacterium]
MPTDRCHPDPEVLAGLAAGRPPAPGEARHLAACPACRRELSAKDPSALFALLAVLPDPVAAPPPPRLGSVPRRSARLLRLALAAAAAAAFAAGVWGVRPPDRRARLAALPELAPIGRAPAPIVRRVDSRRARVVTLLPAGGEGPTVTLILDKELDL